MLASLQAILNNKRLLLAVAAPAEARAVMAGCGCAMGEPPEWRAIPLTAHTDLVVTGVGKAAAAGGVGRVLDLARHGAVLSVGIAGAYGGVELGSVVAADRCVFADEGVDTGGVFQDLASLGFAPWASGMGTEVSGAVLDVLRPLADVVGAIATVSTCSGTDALVARLRERSGAVAEAMEGAAVALVASRVGVPFGELRVISNTTGDRDRQVWRIKEAFGVLERVIGTLAGPE